MNPQVRHAQRACEAAKARQAVVVWFDEHGQFAVASYGETKAESRDSAAPLDSVQSVKSSSPRGPRPGELGGSPVFKRVRLEWEDGTPVGE